MDNYQHPRFWRYFTNSRGERLVKLFIDELSDTDAAAVAVAMERVVQRGLRAARHLRGEIYEVRVAGDRQQFRILFAAEGAYNQVLLALDAFAKRTQATPLERIELAEQRLNEWRRRGGR